MTARTGFREWAEIQVELEEGLISHSEAARRLGCGYATLLRLLQTA